MAETEVKKESLAIILPVYNEEEAIGNVLEKWCSMLDTLDVDYCMHPYNDGSKDNSLQVLKRLEAGHPGRIKVHDKTNSGHGPTILKGYNEAAEAGYTWIFQIDSDDEMGPEKFPELWAKRHDYDFLVGYRDGRKQALPRKIISAISRLTVKIFYGKSIWDVNTPYRLMRTEVFAPIYKTIPENTFAPNVILSGMAARKKLRYFEMSVPQKDRQTGEVSIKKWKLLKAAMKSFRQTISFSLTPAASPRNWWKFWQTMIVCGVIAAAVGGIGGLYYAVSFSREVRIETDYKGSLGVNTFTPLKSTNNNKIIYSQGTFKRYIPVKNGILKTTINNFVGKIVISGHPSIYKKRITSIAIGDKIYTGYDLNELSNKIIAPDGEIKGRSITIEFNAPFSLFQLTVIIAGFIFAVLIIEFILVAIYYFFRQYCHKILPHTQSRKYFFIALLIALFISALMLWGSFISAKMIVKSTDVPYTEFDSNVNTANAIRLLDSENTYPSAAISTGPALLFPLMLYFKLFSFSLSGTTLFMLGITSTLMLLILLTIWKSFPENIFLKLSISTGFLLLMFNTPQMETLNFINGERTAGLLLILSVVLITTPPCCSVKTDNINKTKCIFLYSVSGLCAGLSILCKELALFGLLPIPLLIFWYQILNHRVLKKFYTLAIWLVMALLPALIFKSYLYLSKTPEQLISYYDNSACFRFSFLGVQLGQVSLKHLSSIRNFGINSYDKYIFGGIFIFTVMSIASFCCLFSIKFSQKFKTSIFLTFGALAIFIYLTFSPHIVSQKYYEISFMLLFAAMAFLLPNKEKTKTSHIIIYFFFIAFMCMTKTFERNLDFALRGKTFHKMLDKEKISDKRTQEYLDIINFYQKNPGRYYLFHKNYNISFRYYNQNPYFAIMSLDKYHSASQLKNTMKENVFVIVQPNEIKLLLAPKGMTFEEVYRNDLLTVQKVIKLSVPPPEKQIGKTSPAEKVQKLEKTNTAPALPASPAKEAAPTGKKSGTAI